ncbi:MAG: helix-turn-helix domain-containing protein [Lachnospiraceae bacterium]|nr:helix-turn-helix domain-containing protein [Lachnospiraceae bacterium]
MVDESIIGKLRGQSEDRTLSDQRLAAVNVLDGGQTESLNGGQHALVFLYVCDGEMVVEAGHEEVNAVAGDILILNQYIEYSVEEVGERSDVICLTALPVFFEKSFQMLDRQSRITDFLANALLQGDRTPEYLLLHLGERHPLENLIENLCESLLDDGGRSSEISQYTMGLIFLHLSDHLNRVDPDSAQSYKALVIQETLKYIEQNYKTARLGYLAEKFHQTLSVISKMIKAGTGSTFQELLMTKRFQKASQLLVETNLPVEEIALEIGYENQSYFHRQFKQRYNITPRRYRLKHRRMTAAAGK